MRSLQISLVAIVFGFGLPQLTSSIHAQEVIHEISPARAAALRECNARAERYPLHTYGNDQLYVYRACMAEHGQVQ